LKLRTGGRCGTRAGVDRVLIWLLDLVLGPAGPVRDERPDVIGREAGSCDMTAGDTVAGGAVEERRGGREASGGMEGKRRLLALRFESRSDKPCTEMSTGDWEREFDLERDRELGREPTGDGVHVYGGGEEEGTSDGFKGEFLELIDFRYCCLNERRFTSDSG